jgi:hypothetical protein
LPERTSGNFFAKMKSVYRNLSIKTSLAPLILSLVICGQLALRGGTASAGGDTMIRFHLTK